MIRESVEALSSLPREAWACLAGLFASWGLTQALKFILPRKLTARGRDLATRALAFGIGAGISWGLWPERDGALAAVAVGLASPVLWLIGMRLVGGRWPEVRDGLSGDRS